MKHTSIALAIAATATLLLTACDKTEQATQPTATPPVTPKDSLDTKSKDDLARIRELMEKEEARKQAQEAKSKELGESLVKGARAPVNTFGR